MKKYLQIPVLLLCVVSFGFLFLSHNTTVTNSGITNYYYFQGKKFFLQERTDMLFLKVKKDASIDAARSELMRHPEIDLSSSNLKPGEDVFLKLRAPLTGGRYTSLVNDLKQKDMFENVNYAFSPFGIDDNKTFYGMNDLVIMQFKPTYSKTQIDDINKRNNIEIIQKIDVTGGETFLAKVNRSSSMNAM